jgi:hypothetical protein
MSGSSLPGRGSGGLADLRPPCSRQAFFLAARNEVRRLRLTDPQREIVMRLPNATFIACVSILALGGCHKADPGQAATPRASSGPDLSAATTAAEANTKIPKGDGVGTRGNTTTPNGTSNGSQSPGASATGGPG